MSLIRLETEEARAIKTQLENLNRQQYDMFQQMNGYITAAKEAWSGEAANAWKGVLANISFDAGAIKEMLNRYTKALESAVYELEEADRKNAEETAKMDMGQKEASSTAENSAGASSMEDADQLTARVGQRIADVEKYNNGITGECVWYVRGRAQEKLGVNTGITGNANTWWSKATKNGLNVGSEIRGDSIACFSGPSSYGHVVFVESVTSDTVFFTEANVEGIISDGLISPSDGVLKSISVNDFKAKCGNSLQGYIYL